MHICIYDFVPLKLKTILIFQHILEQQSAGLCAWEIKPVIASDYYGLYV